MLGRLLLGIDPGLAATGYALLREPGDVVACGTIRTAPNVRPGIRLLQIQRELEAILDTSEVAEAAIEELFMGSNRTSVIGVAQARGVILALLESRNIGCNEYAPAQVKLVVSGYGNADKAQMARMLTAQLRTLPDGSDHALDAIAIAICHARSRRVTGQGGAGSPFRNPPTLRGVGASILDNSSGRDEPGLGTPLKKTAYKRASGSFE